MYKRKLKCQCANNFQQRVQFQINPRFLIFTNLEMRGRDGGRDLISNVHIHVKVFRSFIHSSIPTIPRGKTIE